VKRRDEFVIRHHHEQTTCWQASTTEQWSMLCHLL